MKASEVYLKAAELMADPEWGTGCCRAIDRALGCRLTGYNTPEHKYFEKYFPWATSEITWGCYAQGLDRQPRVIALLLMSEFAKDDA